MALVAVLLAVGWAGTATAQAQTQEDTDFGGGAHANTEVLPSGDLALSPAIDVSEEFDGTTLPSGWEMAPWGEGGTATVGGGALTVDGARAHTTGVYDSGRSLDFGATFTADPFQHVGFGDTLDGAPWAIFSTGGGALATGLYARTWAPGASSSDNTEITGVDPLVPHDYSIEWTSTEVRYFIDGVLEVTHPIAITAPMRPIASDFNVGDGSVRVDHLDLYATPTTYPTSGTFTSRVLDAGDSSATWRTLSAALDTPQGTDVTFEVRTGSTATPDAFWTAFQPVSPGGEISSPSGRRYVQYRATLTTTNPSVTPFVQSVTLGYDVDGSAPATTIGGVTVSGGTASVVFSSEAGASFECSLDAGTFQPCTSPRQYTGLSDGTHTVRVRATDQAGNVGAAAERSFTVDTVAPATTISDVTVTGRAASVVFSSEAGASFECSLDTGTFQPCTSPRQYTGLSDGTHTVRVRATDQAGNVGPAAERSFVVSSIGTPPNTSTGTPGSTSTGTPGGTSTGTQGDASTGTPVDATAPNVRPRPRSVKVSESGRFRLRLHCASGEVRCRILLRLRFRGETMVTKRVTVFGGDTERVTLRLKRSARAVLVFRGRLRVLAVTTARDAAGNRGTTRTRMTLRATVTRR